MSETFNTISNKLFYGVIAFTGICLLILMGVYFGYTLKENDKYISSKYINEIKYINNNYVYNTIYVSDTQYRDYISSRISYIITILSIISLCLVEIGYYGLYKYKYKKSFKERYKELFKNIRIEMNREIKKGL